MLSWFSFWIGLDAIPGRVTLLVTSMLTLVTMFTGLKSDIPPVAYVKVRLSSMFPHAGFVKVRLSHSISYMMVNILVLSHEDLRNPTIYSFFVCFLNVVYKNRVEW
jgi:hypothetical protein